MKLEEMALIIFVRKKITSCYQCIPTPPGYIPTLVMLKVENENETFNAEALNRSGLEEQPTVIDRSNHEQEAGQDGDRIVSRNIQENTLCSASLKHLVKNGGYTNTAKVLTMFKVIRSHFLFTCFIYSYKNIPDSPFYDYFAISE